MKHFIALAALVLVAVAFVESRAVRDLKSTLIAKGSELIRRAEEATRKLEHERKLQEVAIIKSEEAAIRRLISELETTTDSTKLARIEHELARAETKLQSQLSQVHTFAKRDLKSNLITKSNELLKKADAEIKKLTAEKKTREVEVLKKEETAIKTLVASLEKETDEAKIKTLERELNAAEAKLNHELQRIGNGSNNDALKAVLLKRAQELEKKADVLIKKLKEEKKDAEAAVVAKDEALVKKLVAELNAATSSTDIKLIEHQLLEAEKRLAKDEKQPRN